MSIVPVIQLVIILPSIYFLGTEPLYTGLWWAALTGTTLYTLLLFMIMFVVAAPIFSKEILAKHIVNIVKRRGVSPDMPLSLQVTIIGTAALAAYYGLLLVTLVSFFTLVAEGVRKNKVKGVFNAMRGE